MAKGEEDRRPWPHALLIFDGCPGQPRIHVRDVRKPTEFCIPDQKTIFLLIFIKYLNKINTMKITRNYVLNRAVGVRK